MYKIKEEFLGQYVQRKGRLISLNENVSEVELELLAKMNHPAIIKIRAKKKKVDDNRSGSISGNTES